MTTPVDLQAEGRRLVRQYGVVRRRVERVEAVGGESVALGAGGGPRNVVVEPGADDTVTAWLDTYPNLAATDVLAERIPAIVEQLASALAGLPPMPPGQLSEGQAALLREVFAPVHRAVLLVEQYLYAVQALRGLISTATGEEDASVLDAYAIVGAILKSPAYTNFDRILVKLTRLTKAGKERLAEYNAKPESVAKRAAYTKNKRATDPEYRGRENARRREKYAENRPFRDLLAAIDREYPEPGTEVPR